MDLSECTEKKRGRKATDGAAPEVALDPEPEPTLEPELAVVNPEPPEAPPVEDVPAGVRTRASLRTYGPIGVRYSPPS